MSFIVNESTGNPLKTSQILRGLCNGKKRINDKIPKKYEEDPIKNKGARVLTTLYIHFSDAQGQLTLQSVVGSGQNSNSSKLLWLSSLTARIKNTLSKMKALECIKHYSHYKSMGIFPDAQG